jgi:two-component system, chemotaxis family, protein-glutamate methylesterase/glutaminase
MNQTTPFGPPRSIILIGASTGGTRVLAEIIGRLPRLPACIVIVQHMPAFINASFVRTLSRSTPAEVRLARHGDRLHDGLILLAPSDLHCTLLANRSICLAPGVAVNYVCPSVDLLMQSARKQVGLQQLIGVLLTGMGKDGAAGMLHIRNLGGFTIAQNRGSCAVHGMPAEAVNLGCVDVELPPLSIARLLEAKTTGLQHHAADAPAARLRSADPAR